jgi:hypothetical protein
MRGIVLLSSIAILAACNDSPTQEEYDEVAAGLGSLVSSGDGGGDVGSMGDSVALLTGDVPFGLSVTGSGSFAGLRGGLMYEYGVTCLDASGATMALCDSTTDAGRLTIAWSGELDTPTFSGSIARTGDWSVSGLQSDVAVFEGEGTFDVDAEWLTLFGTRKTYQLDYDAEYSAIGIRTSDHVAVSGEARWDVHAMRTRERGSNSAEAEFQIEAVLTFEEGSATLTLDGAHRYRVDIDSGSVSRL